jgi:hypothetical protein
MSHSRRDWDFGRQPWYDRNAEDVSIIFGTDGVAPHAQTTRASYTVPAGKRAIVAAALASVQRATAPSSGLARLQADIIVVIPSIVALVVARLIDGTQGAHMDMVLATSTVLDAGAVVSIRTYDDNIGGTVDYLLSAQIVEFDA